jgi:hypothetical protein
MKLRTTLVVLLSVLALVAAACGGSESGISDTSAAEVGEESVPEAESEAQAGEEDDESGHLNLRPSALFRYRRQRRRFCSPSALVTRWSPLIASPIFLTKRP